MKTIANGPDGPSYIIEIRTFWAYLIGTSAITGMLSVMLMMYFIAPEPTITIELYPPSYNTNKGQVELWPCDVYDKGQYIWHEEALDER